MISIEVTTRCNLNCKNCFAHADGSELRDINYNKAITILDEARELGSTLLSITGGEPLLWDNTIKLMTYAKSIGYEKFFLNTNGHLLTDDLCNSLSTFGDGLDISCSVNGDMCIHDDIRGAGSYYRVMSGIKTALKHELNILVYTVVSRDNLYSIPKFTESLFKEFPKLKSLVFIQLRGVDDDYYSVENLKLEPKEFIEWVKMVGYLALAGYPVMILENSLSTVASKKLGLKWLPGSPEISRAGKIVVLQNGIITDNHSSLVQLGLYKYGALKDVFASDKYKQITSDESDECLGCEFITLCRDSGKLRPSEIFHNTGDLLEFYCKKVLRFLV
jgi:MoaA/NifB/PqqE/SkfB family radical SAM enzyme